MNQMLRYYMRTVSYAIVIAVSSETQCIYVCAVHVAIGLFFVFAFKWDYSLECDG